MKLFRYIFSIAIFIGGCTNKNGVSSFAPGDRAPDFELSILSGQGKKLSDYRGKTILLNFWASWCGPCISELPALQNLNTKLSDQNFEVVSVGIDDTKPALEEFVQRFKLTFPVFLDLNGEIKNRYRLTGVPESFVIDKEGNFVMILDPNDNNPVVRIIGPRAWDKPAILAQFRSIL